MSALAFLDRRGHWVAAPAGAALAGAFAPTGIAPLAELCPAVLFLLWHDTAPRTAAWRGFLFTGGTFLAGTYWLYHSIHLVGQAPLWVAAFLMLGLVAIMGSYSAVLGYAVARWGPDRGPLRWLVLLPAGWVAVEWFRGWFLSGFPWLALGYSQLETPLRGFAPLAGVYGTSLAVALLAGALVTLAHYQPPPALSLHGKTALILVFGHVGQRIGGACAALGMRVIAIRRHPQKPINLGYPAEIYNPESLTELLPQADAILIALPGTPETHGLLCAAEIALLPRGAVLVNVGRGPIVVQHALFQALKKRHLRAAGLDVWYHYPSSQAEWESTPPADETFHELEHVVLSPHRANGSSETDVLRMEHLAELLNAIARNEPLPDPVDLVAGY